MPIIFNKYYPLRTIVFFLGEGLLILLSLLITDWFFTSSGLFYLDFGIILLQAFLVTMIFQLCLYFFDLYDLASDLTLTHTITRMTQAFGVGCIILGTVYYTIPFMMLSGRVFWAAYIVICLSVSLWRGAYYLILRKRLFVQGVIIVGTGEFASDIAREIEGVHDSIYKIIRFIGESEPEFNPNQAPVFRELSPVEELEDDHEIERVIIALDDRRGVMPINTLLDYKIHGIPIENGVTFYERVTGKILVEKLAPSWIIFSDGFSVSRWKYQVKRMIDISLSLTLLFCSLPILILTALLIKLESPGPVFYLQKRVGFKNKEFNVIKFRSMGVDAEKNGAVWAQENDDRVTRVGKVIRKLRIDELPQLFNVLRGEMSLVGPRPERQVFVDRLKKVIPFYAIRHELKPGVTGWAQVCYPYGASEEDALKKLEYDLYYMKNLSIALDLLVIFKTIKTVLFRVGAR